ncbi:type II secretion system protein N, partial [Pseudomonas sp. B30(2017)]
MRFTARFSPPQIIQAAALLTALVGIATWSSLLLTTAESHTPAATLQLLAARSDNPALQWFSNRTAPVEIKVSGVMAGSRGAVAILSLNDGPPRSFLQGERVSPGVKLVTVEGDGVVIEQGG